MASKIVSDNGPAQPGSQGDLRGKIVDSKGNIQNPNAAQKAAGIKTVAQAEASRTNSSDSQSLTTKNSGEESGATPASTPEPMPTNSTNIFASSFPSKFGYSPYSTEVQTANAEKAGLKPVKGQAGIFRDSQGGLYTDISNVTPLGNDQVRVTATEPTYIGQKKVDGKVYDEYSQPSYLITQPGRDPSLARNDAPLRQPTTDAKIFGFSVPDAALVTYDNAVGDFSFAGGKVYDFSSQVDKKLDDPFLLIGPGKINVDVLKGVNYVVGSAGLFAQNKPESAISNLGSGAATGFAFTVGGELIASIPVIGAGLASAPVVTTVGVALGTLYVGGKAFEYYSADSETEKREVIGSVPFDLGGFFVGGKVAQKSLELLPIGSVLTFKGVQGVESSKIIGSSEAQLTLFGEVAPRGKASANYDPFTGPTSFQGRDLGNRYVIPELDTPRTTELLGARALAMELGIEPAFPRSTPGPQTKLGADQIIPGAIIRVQGGKTEATLSPFTTNAAADNFYLAKARENIFNPSSTRQTQLNTFFESSSPGGFKLSEGQLNFKDILYNARSSLLKDSVRDTPALFEFLERKPTVRSTAASSGSSSIRFNQDALDSFGTRQKLVLFQPESTTQRVDIFNFRDAEGKNEISIFKSVFERDPVSRSRSESLLQRESPRLRTQSNVLEVVSLSKTKSELDLRVGFISLQSLRQDSQFRSGRKVKGIQSFSYALRQDSLVRFELLSKTSQDQAQAFSLRSAQTLRSVLELAAVSTSGGGRSGIANAFADSAPKIVENGFFDFSPPSNANKRKKRKKGFSLQDFFQYEPSVLGILSGKKSSKKFKRGPFTGLEIRGI